MKSALGNVSSCGALAASLLLSACAVALSPQGAGVQVSDEHMVHHCQYLGDVTGDSVNTDTARNDARNRAAAMGATNVVFVSQSNAVTSAHAGGPNSAADAMGRAYRCPTGAQPPSAPESPAVPAPPAT